MTRGAIGNNPLPPIPRKKVLARKWNTPASPRTLGELGKFEGPILIKSIRSYSINKQLIPNHLIKELNVSKIEDFGVHCKQYYSLEVSYFKSAMDKRLLDSLWNHYWVNTLSSSLLITNSEYTTGNPDI